MTRLIFEVLKPQTVFYFGATTDTMWLPLIFLSSFLASGVFSLSQNTCPPAEEVKPCSCHDSGKVTAVCSDVIDGIAIANVFSKNPSWSIEYAHFDRCVIDYIPSQIAMYESLQQLNVSSSKLASLFDKPLAKTPEDINIYLYDVKVQRGMQWELLANSSLAGLGTFNVEVKNFGKDFKEYMPQSVKNLWFENSKTIRISYQAFQRMVNLEILTLTGGSIKKISRDMFPKPWKVKFWNLSQQKIAALPKDIFEDMPELTMFSMIKNSLITIDKDVFTKPATSYFLKDNPIDCNCDIKWITTSGKQNVQMFFGNCESPDSFKGKKLNSLKEEDFNFCQ